MSDKTKRYSLPSGWYEADETTASYLYKELQRELTQGHLLDGKQIVVFAYRNGVTDDILVRHCDNSDRFTVVHLSWLGRTEIDAWYPMVEFDGNFDDFLVYEKSYHRNGEAD